MNRIIPFFVCFFLCGLSFSFNSFVSGSCKKVNWNDHKNRVQARQFLTRLVSNSSYVRSMTDRLATLSMNGSTSGSFLKKVLGIQYTFDHLAGSFHLDGLNSISIGDINVRGSDTLRIPITIGNFSSHVHFEADYQKHSILIRNQSYCPFSFQAWNRACDHQQFFLNSSISIENLKALVNMKVVMMECSGPWYSRWPCSLGYKLSNFINFFRLKWISTYVRPFQKLRMQSLELNFDHLDVKFHLQMNAGDKPQDTEYFVEKHLKKNTMDPRKYEILVGATREAILQSFNEEMEALEKTGWFPGKCYGWDSNEDRNQASTRGRERFTFRNTRPNFWHGWRDSNSDSDSSSYNFDSDSD